MTFTCYIRLFILVARNNLKEIYSKYTICKYIAEMDELFWYRDRRIEPISNILGLGNCFEETCYTEDKSVMANATYIT